MKAGTLEKLKFKRLRSVLGLPDWQLVGVLESVWQATYHNAPAGDIGRLSNQDIAACIGWTDDPDTLVNALVETGWLDTDPIHRLLIHDWEEHCAAWLKANFARHGKQFAQPTEQLTEQLTEQPTKHATKHAAMQGSAKLPPNQAKPNLTNPRDTTVSKDAPPPFPSDIDSPQLREARDNWIGFKAESGHQYKPRALKALVTRMSKRAREHGEQTVVDAIERAIGTPYKGWDFDEWFAGKGPTQSRVATPADLEHFDLINGSAR